MSHQSGGVKNSVLVSLNPPPDLTCSKYSETIETKSSVEDIDENVIKVPVFSTEKEQNSPNKINLTVNDLTVIDNKVTESLNGVGVANCSSIATNCVTSSSTKSNCLVSSSNSLTSTAKNLVSTQSNSKTHFLNSTTSCSSSLVDAKCNNSDSSLNGNNEAISTTTLLDKSLSSNTQNNPSPFIELCKTSPDSSNQPLPNLISNTCTIGKADIDSISSLCSNKSQSTQSVDNILSKCSSSRKDSIESEVSTAPEVTLLNVTPVTSISDTKLEKVCNENLVNDVVSKAENINEISLASSSCCLQEKKSFNTKITLPVISLVESTSPSINNHPLTSSLFLPSPGHLFPPPLICNGQREGSMPSGSNFSFKVPSMNSIMPLPTSTCLPLTDSIKTNEIVDQSIGSSIVNSSGTKSAFTPVNKKCNIISVPNLKSSNMAYVNGKISTPVVNTNEICSTTVSSVITTSAVVSLQTTVSSSSHAHSNCGLNVNNTSLKDQLVRPISSYSVKPTNILDKSENDSLGSSLTQSSILDSGFKSGSMNISKLIDSNSQSIANNDPLIYKQNSLSFDFLSPKLPLSVDRDSILDDVGALCGEARSNDSASDNARTLNEKSIESSSALMLPNSVNNNVEKYNLVNNLTSCDNDINVSDICDTNSNKDNDPQIPDCTNSVDSEESEAGDSCCSTDPGECAVNPYDDYFTPRSPVCNGAIECSSNLKRKATESSSDEKGPKKKKGIQFEGVTVFYFPRSQGFTCVPSQGGSTLGMSRRHFHIRQFSLAEHAAEQRRAHREYLMKLRRQRTARERGETGSRGSSSEDSEENSEEMSDLSDSELEADSYFFLQPLPIRQRRALLRQSGIRQIEGLEKEDCKDIRVSREMCGCQCKFYCYQDSCQCAQAGIKCQVDRHNFPCGCSRDGCGNSQGRIEFNPLRVRTHFLHTLMRIELERRQQWQQDQQTQFKDQPNLFKDRWVGGGSGTGAHENVDNHLQVANAANVATSSGALTFFSSANNCAVVTPNMQVDQCMGGPIYNPFDARQLVGSSSNSVYVSHDTGTDYSSGGVFSGISTTFDAVAPYNGSPFMSPVSTNLNPSPHSSSTCPAYHSLSPKLPTDSLSPISFSTPQSPVSPFPYTAGNNAVAAAVAAAASGSYSPASNYCPTSDNNLIPSSGATITFGDFHNDQNTSRSLFDVGIPDSTNSLSMGYEDATSCLASGKMMMLESYSSPLPNDLDEINVDSNKDLNNSFNPLFSEPVTNQPISLDTLSKSKTNPDHLTEEDTNQTEKPTNNESHNSDRSSADNVKGCDEIYNPFSSPSISKESKTDNFIQPSQNTSSDNNKSSSADSLADIVKKSMIETVSA